MSLIVEDGSGMLTSESYASVAELQTYCTNFGLTPPVDTLSCEIGLRKATSYMTKTFRGTWNGYRTVHNQALDFPRLQLYRDDYDWVDINTVPPEVKETCILLALIAQTQELLPTTFVRGQKSVKIGPLEVVFDGDSNSTTKFINATRGIAIFLNANANGFTSKLVRG